MFCPRCGQQAAEEIHFCSRCGLPLGTVAEVVERGGELARPGAVSGLTPRQKGIRKGLMLLVGGLLSFKAAVLLTVYKEDLFVLLIPAGIFIIVGVMRMLYGLLLEEHTRAQKPLKSAGRDAAPALAREAARAAELPPARTVPISSYARPGADTSDMAAAPPPSVTENTTRLLDEEESGRR
jgi:hypothetical protein